MNLVHVEGGLHRRISINQVKLSFGPWHPCESYIGNLLSIEAVICQAATVTLCYRECLI